jgi:hypothetical protein
MQSTRHLARLAAASTATVFMTVAALGPVFATEGETDSEGAGKGAGQSATSHGSVKSEERKSETPVAAHADPAGKSDGKSDGKTTGPDHSAGNASTTGEATSPQPESKADRTDRGANAGTCSETQRDHAYCSTRDGSPSQNGVGDGKAKGKPCAGCVGKADNKNPKGQHPDGSDRNAGYECDRNQGIGKGNPAHTGCVTGEKPEKPEKPGEKPEKPGEKPEKPGEKPGEKPEKPGEKPDEEIPAVTPITPSGPGPVDEVAGVAAPGPAPAAWAPSATAPTAGVLPATGAGEYALHLMAGLGLLAAGGLLAIRRRPQTVR